MNSPNPKETVPLRKTMDFPQAIQTVIKGGKVTKLEWGNPKTYIFLQDGFLRIKKEDGTIPKLPVSEGDLIGMDWINID